MVQFSAAFCKSPRRVFLGFLCTFHYYGPYSGYSAGGIADGLNGKTQILWNNVSGLASFWNLDTPSAVFTHNEFGPYGGWTAVGISN